MTSGRNCRTPRITDRNGDDGSGRQQRSEHTCEDRATRTASGRVSRLTTPSAVVDELNRADAAGYEFVDRIDAVKTYNGGWLEVVAPSETELSMADDIRDHALSTTDAHCIAIADCRGEQLLTDDAHVGTIAGQRDVEVWDLVALLQRSIGAGEVENVDELETILDDLRLKDNYWFSEDDTQYLSEQFDP